MSLCHIAVHIPIWMWTVGCLETKPGCWRQVDKTSSSSIVCYQTPKAMERWEKGGQQPIKNVRRECIHGYDKGRCTQMHRVCRDSTNFILNDFSNSENRGEKEPFEIQRNGGGRKWKTKTNLTRYVKVVERYK